VATAACSRGIHHVHSPSDTPLDHPTEIGMFAQSTGATTVRLSRWVMASQPISSRRESRFGVKYPQCGEQWQNANCDVGGF